MANTLVFLGSTQSSSSQLFTLGTAVGTAVETSFTGYGSGNAGPVDMTAFGGGTVFNGGLAGSQGLWKLDASGNASQITDGSLSPDLNPLNLTAVGSALFFSGTDASGNGNLYVSDGTAGGTRALSVGNAGSGGLMPDEIVAANGKVFFSGTDATGSTGLWVSDGTTAGTAELAVANTDTQNIAQMGTGLHPSNITLANGQIFFAGTDSNGEVGLWKSDGTAAGTVELDISNAAAGGISPTSSNIVSFNGLTYFAGQDASGNIGLWVTDGSGGDTTELAIGNSSANGLAPVSLTVMNGSLYFGGTDASGNTGLWKSDGTAAGTHELQVAGTAPGGLAPISLNVSDYPNAPMAVLNGKLYFAGAGADGTEDLWTSDGTGTGTVQITTQGTTSTLGIMPTDFTVMGAPATSTSNVVAAAVASLTIGSGHDTITFYASEDAYQGDAQFTISVDGKQVGGIQTETALRSQSQAQKITLNGDWGDGTHVLSISFLNGASGEMATVGGGLYVSTSTYNGVSAKGNLALLAGASKSLTIGTAAPGTTTIGSGTDSITLQMSEDAFQGDAQFIATVDGVSVGGVRTVIASHSAGQSQQFDLLGSFGPGSHTVGINFINDAAGPTYVQDRNLYVDSASYDGGSSFGKLTMMSGGSQALNFQAEPSLPTDAGAPVSTTMPVTTTPNPVTNVPQSGTGSTEVLVPTMTTSSSTGRSNAGVGAVSSTAGLVTVPGASAPTSGTAVLASVDTTEKTFATTDYVISQNSSGKTYMTPGSGVSLTTATSLANVVYSQGSDTIAAGGTSDLVFASGSAATVTGGGGTLVFVSGSGNYTAGGGTGTNILYGGSGAAVLTGGLDAGNILVAGTGNATLIGGSGSRTLMFGGSGTTLFVGSTGGSDTMVGGTGANTFELTNGGIAFGGPGGTDVFDAGKGSSLIVEGGGTTQVSLGGGSVTAFSGSGLDTYTVSKGLGGEATIVGFKAGDQINLTGGFTSFDATNALKTASAGSFGTTLNLADGTVINLSGFNLNSAQITIS